MQILGDDLSWARIPDQRALVHSDSQTVMGTFGPGYTRHSSAHEWLLTTVANLLDDLLAISFASLLRGGAIAWVEAPMPETASTSGGVAYRPNLLATTSFDGSIATTYKRCVTDVVCDNSGELAPTEPGRSSRSSTSLTAPVCLETL